MTHSQRAFLYALLPLLLCIPDRDLFADESDVQSHEAAPYPRIAMLWAGERGEQSWKSYARHDLMMLGTWSLGLKLDGEPKGLATDFTTESVEVAKERLAELRRLNPDAIILADLLFYEYPDKWLPEDHPWWLRKEGKRQQFWPGTHRMDWSRADYQEKIINLTAALQQTGVDGVFYDNLREEPEVWTTFLTSLREKVEDDFLIFANSGYSVGRHDFAAPFLNGIMYESGWSHGRTQWDDLIGKLQHTETLLREPRISLIERFEEVRSHAGWPGDSKRGQKPEADPAARRWSLCFALTVGDFYYLFSDNTSHKHDWHPEYDMKIGQPTAPGQRLNSHAWKRDFSGGEVYVNLPGAAEPLDISLHYEAKDALTGQIGRTFEIPPGEGRILIRTK